MSAPLRGIPRTVIVLGFASFFTDFSTEMIYPLLPVFLATVLGAGAFQLGIIEGVAESTASILKVVSGLWTDRVHKRRPFVLWGYGLAGTVRPLIGLATSWPMVLALRFTDRVGKGLRTSPRDALITDVTEESHRGKAFGFHQAMDHAGAVIGPLAASVLLKFAGLSLRQVFLMAAIPAAIVIGLLIFFLDEPPGAKAVAKDIVPRESLSVLGPDYLRFLVALLIFTLGGSADAFLLLRLRDAGLATATVALLWSLQNGFKMVSTYGGGLLADRFNNSRLQILIAWLIYAGVYFGFGRAHSSGALVTLFLVYSLYYGLVDPAQSVLVSQLAPPQHRGSAFGYFHGTEGIAALPASLVFGWIWKTWGMGPAFYTGAALAGAACLILVTSVGTGRRAGRAS